jgi:hypothetical protein
MNLVNNKSLRTEILKRIKELEYSYSFLINDAAERKMTIKPERLSKWVNGKSGGITEEQLLWLATRVGIYINLNFGKLVQDKEGKFTYKITPYNELEALTALNRIFPPKTVKNG